MQANPAKFQAIVIGNNTHNQHIIFNLNGNNIKCDEEVKLLGATIDFKLDFNTHISNICKKKKKKKKIKKRKKEAARQLDVLKRGLVHI